MDDERLKNGGSVLTVEYFDRLLEQICEIRLSERRFYQKITDIYATALDYDRTAKNNKAVLCKGPKQDALCGSWTYSGGVDLRASRC